MADAARTIHRPADAAEFRAWEAAQAEKHEFRNGQIRMMTGATKRHNQIALNIAAALKTKLAGSPCRPFVADMLVETDVNSSFYPDVVVDCGPHQPDALAAASPRVVFEVLSASTRNGDFAEKVPDYRDTASVEQIVLVEPDQQRLHVWTRNKEGWRQSQLGARSRLLKLPSLAVELALAEIYDGALEG